MKGPITHKPRHLLRGLCMKTAPCSVSALWSGTSRRGGPRPTPEGPGSFSEHQGSEDQFPPGYVNTPLLLFFIMWQVRCLKPIKLEKTKLSCPFFLAQDLKNPFVADLRTAFTFCYGKASGRVRGFLAAALWTEPRATSRV